MGGSRANLHRTGVTEGRRRAAAPLWTERLRELQQEFITPYMPEQNGIIERFFRSLKERVLSRNGNPCTLRGWLTYKIGHLRGAQSRLLKDKEMSTVC